MKLPQLTSLRPWLSPFALSLSLTLTLLLCSQLQATSRTVSSLSSTVMGYGGPSPITGGSASSADGKSRYEFQPVFTVPPRSGYMSYRVRVTGEGKDKGLSFHADADSSYWDYSGWNSQRVTREFKHTSKLPEASNWRHALVPLPPVEDTSRSSSSRSSNGSYQISLTHRGESVNLNYESINSSRLPSAHAISGGAAQRAQDQLEVLVRTERFYPSLFDPAHLPADWRAFHGFGSVTLTRQEWRDLTDPVRRSLLEYVRLGGDLRLQSPAPREENLPNLTSSSKHALGLGTVSFVSLVAPSKPQNFTLSEQSPALESQVEEAGKAGFFTILAVLALGIVLGPLNLFWFTRGKRHRLFFTIPLISLAASLLFVGIILLRDGTGGKGERFAVISLSPDFNGQGATASILQQQSSRSGALLGKGFETENPLFMRLLGNSRSSSNDSGDQDLSLTSSAGRSFSGDWFQSRQRQTYELAAVIPSRLSLSVQEVGEGELEVTNSTDVGLSFVSVRLNNQSYYFEGEVPSGGKAKLSLAKQAEIKSKLDNYSEPLANNALSKEIREAFGRQNQIVAFAPEADSLCLDTLESIRWKKSTAVIIQPLK